MTIEKIQFHPVQGVTLGGRKSDRAHQTIKRGILLGQYPAGTQLLEQALASEFGCSQSTVREGLQKLAEEGLVERRGYQGTFVTETTLDQAAEMVRVRVQIERAAARRLSQLRPDTGLLLRMTREMDEARTAGDAAHCSELDRAFHGGLVRASGLDLLAPILYRCTLHIHRFTVGGSQQPRRFFQETGIGEEHRILLKTILEGDADTAERAVIDHIGDVIRHWSPELMEATGIELFEERAAS